MKIGWLVYRSYYDDDNNCIDLDVEFHKVKPEYYSGRCVQIVYSEVVEDAN